MNILKIDIKRILSSGYIWVTSSLVFLIGIVQCFVSYPDPRDHAYTLGPLNCFLAAYVTGGFSAIAFPIIACMSFSTAYIDDLQSGYIKNIFMRKRKRSYLFQRSLSVAITGGIPFIIGSVLLLGFFIILDPLPSGKTQILKGAFAGVYHHSMLLYSILYITNTFVSGAIYALLGMAMCSITNNRYLGLIIPVLLGFSATIISWIIPIQIVRNILFSVLPSSTFTLVLTDNLSLLKDYLIMIILFFVSMFISKKMFEDGRW